MFEVNKKTLRNVFIGVGVCILLYWLLNATDRVQSIFSVIKGVLSPFVLGAGIAFVINVPMRAIERLLKGIKKFAFRRLLALLLTIVAVLIVLAGVFWLLIPQIEQTFQSLLPKLYDFALRLEVWITNFLNDNPELLELVSENTSLETLDWSTLLQNLIQMLGDSVSTIVSRAFDAIGSVTSALMNFVISIVFTVYCLFQKEALARQGKKLLYAFLPEHMSDAIIRVLHLANCTFSNFLSGQCIEVCILGCLFAVSMAIFGMPYIPLVSVLVAVTAFIPVVGAWIGCAFGAFFIMIDDPMLALWFIVLFVVLQQIENNLIYPRVVGTSIGLSGMWVLVAIGVGGELMGVAGMFLMIPATSVLYTLMREIVNRRILKREISAEKLKLQPLDARIRKEWRRTKPAPVDPDKKDETK